MHILFFLVFLITTSMECRFVAFHNLEHNKTGQQVILIGDCHGKEQYAAENKAALLNLAYTYDAHIIVEDMSDCSFLERYLDKNIFQNVDIFAAMSVHSRERMAYTSLSLTYHCKRKNIAVSNVEFRHWNVKAHAELAKLIYVSLLEQFRKAIDVSTQQMLSDEYVHLLKDVLPFIEDLIEREMSVETNDGVMSDLDCLFSYVLDMLIMKDFLDITYQNHDKMIIICAGNGHIDRLLSMLMAHDYKTKRSGAYEYRTMHELRLQPIFDRYILNGKDKKRCISCISINMYNRKRVWSHTIKKAMTIGTLCAAVLSLFSVYVKTKYLQQYTQW